MAPSDLPLALEPGEGGALPLPGGFYPSFVWLLFLMYLVGGLFWTGDLPGMPRAP